MQRRDYPPAKRFRPNEPPVGDRHWMPPPDMGPPYYDAPPPEFAPYNAGPHDYPPNDAYNPPPYGMAPLHPSQPPISGSLQSQSMGRKRHTKSVTDPRRSRHMPQSSHLNSGVLTSSSAASDAYNSSVNSVLHFSKGDLSETGFVVVMKQIYGPTMTDPLPFGGDAKDAIEMDGRIKLEQILRFLPQAINSPKRVVRVFELKCLGARDQMAYDTFCKYYTKHNRAAVVDKESIMGVLLYFLPPQIAKSTIDFKKIVKNSAAAAVSKNKDSKSKKLKKSAQKAAMISALYEKQQNGDESVSSANIDPSLLVSGSPISIADYLQLSVRPKSNVWMISITSHSKALLYRTKSKHTHTSSSVTTSTATVTSASSLSTAAHNNGSTNNKDKSSDSELDDLWSVTDSDEDNESEKTGDNGSGDESKTSDMYSALQKLYQNLNAN